MTNVFYNLVELLKEGKLQGYFALVSLIVILGLMIWVSVSDIKRQSVTFWKMLIASGSTIILPFITSFTCGCGKLKWYLLASIPLWFLFLFVNIKRNKDKIIGRADVDLLSALASEGIMYSFWLYSVLDANVRWIRITQVWYNFFLYIVVGAIVYVILFLIVFGIQMALKKKTLKQVLKCKISAIPMFIPVAIMMPYIFMTS